MAINYNVKGINSGLIVCLDAANPKSYSGSGTAWVNLVANNSATLSGTPTYNGKDFYFDGTGQGATLTNTLYPVTWADPYTLEIWFKIPEEATWNNGYNSVIVSRGAYTGVHGITRSTSNNVISCYVRGSAETATTSTTIERDKWYQAVSTWNGSNTKIFANGTFKNTSSNYAHSGQPTSSNWIMGIATAFGGSIGNAFQGNIAVLKIYNKALTPDEVSVAFNALRGRFGL